MTPRVAAEELRAFVEMFERLEAEKKEVADAQKDVMSEARARRYDVKTLRALIALRKKTPDELADEEAMLEMYREALGI